ncbi:hypothetical protein IWQ56_001623 [Coemansia nantahalensis]|nr:hypothetical protein IWQ56_001623 [Coemansia nantahalensis]
MAAAEGMGIAPELTATCTIGADAASDKRDRAARTLSPPASLRLAAGETLVTAPSADGRQEAVALPVQSCPPLPAGRSLAVDGTLSLSIRPAGWTRATLGASIRRLGAGTGGHVDLHRSPGTQKMIAVKTLQVKGEPVVGPLSRRALEELGISMNARHRNIVHTHEVVVEPDRRCYVVMEACATDLLALLLRPARVESAVLGGYFAQLVRGVHYLHSIGIAHRDLKLDNVCVTADGVVKIIDFGCATLFRRRAPPAPPQRRAARHRAAPYTAARQPVPPPAGQYVETLSTGVCGSDPYMAPELFAGGHYSAPKADVWALGIILFAMRHQQFPWGAAQEARDARFREYARAPGAFLDTWPADDAGWAPVPVGFLNMTQRRCAGPASPRRLLRHALDPSPAARTDVAAILRDPWFASLSRE